MSCLSIQQLINHHAQSANEWFANEIASSNANEFAITQIAIECLMTQKQSFVTKDLIITHGVQTKRKRHLLSQETDAVIRKTLLAEIRYDLPNLSQTKSDERDPKYQAILKLITDRDEEELHRLQTNNAAQNHLLKVLVKHPSLIAMIVEEDGSTFAKSMLELTLNCIIEDVKKSRNRVSELKDQFAICLKNLSKNIQSVLAETTQIIVLNSIEFTLTIESEDRERTFTHHTDHIVLPLE